MTVSEILELTRAGYTKEEIQAMETGKEPEPTKEPEPAKDPEPAKEPEPQNNDLLKVLVSKFEELTGVIQENNILQSNNKMVENPQPEELLAQVIAPPRK